MPRVLLLYELCGGRVALCVVDLDREHRRITGRAFHARYNYARAYLDLGEPAGSVTGRDEDWACRSCREDHRHRIPAARPAAGRGGRRPPERPAGPAATPQPGRVR